MRKSFFLKTLSGFLFLSFSITFVIFIASARMITRYNREQVLDHFQHMARTIHIAVAPFLENNDGNGLLKWINLYKKNSPMRITIIAMNGDVLADSAADPIHMENHLDRPEVRSALHGNSASATHESSTLHRMMMYYAHPIMIQEKVWGVIRLSLNIKTIEEVLWAIKEKLLILLSIVFLLSLLIAVYFSQKISLPVREMIRTSQKIIAGDQSARVYLKQQDEFKTLADRFNEMTAHQQKLIEDNQQKQNELQTILASLSDPLVVIDEYEHILLFNEAFARLSRCDDGIGKLHWEVIREHGFQSLVQKAQREKINIRGDIEIKNKVYSGNVHFLNNRKGIVVMLHEITEQKQLEKMKKDFIVNMSHELRTPLTAIKGFLETMSDNESESNKKYMEIVQRNTDRMIHIVHDLLALAELEEKQNNPIELQQVDIAALVEQTWGIFEKKAEEKNLEFSLEIRKPLPLIYGDDFHLEQMLINLIDNAIKYTDHGFIRINVDSEPGKVKINIIDSGIGIPEEHLQRIFERFYVVDKSRSRKMGGTGLGLAIVKHIVRMHHGEISVDSLPGKGTVFHIILPAVK